MAGQPIGENNGPRTQINPYNSYKVCLTIPKWTVMDNPLFLKRIVMERARTIMNPVQIAIIIGIIIPCCIGTG